MNGDFWASDVAVSMPLPPIQTPRQSMDGFVVTDGGLAHDISDADYERISLPTYSPEGRRPDVQWEDTDVETFKSMEVL